MAPLLHEIRGLLSQEAAIPALRVLLFLFGVFGAFSWSRRRPVLTVLVLSMGGLLGLSYWLVQIVSPLGLGTGGALGRQWAQAGVNAFAEPKGPGFVLGTSAEISLIATLASMGLPVPLVFDIPQFAPFLFLGLVLVLPRAFIRNPSTAAFSGGLAVGGGLWPGVSPYQALLLRPSLFAAACVTFGIALVIARSHGIRTLFNRSRLGLSLGVIAAAAFYRAQSGGVESGTDALLLLVASMMLASPLRASLRRASHSAQIARRAEALILLGAFTGSGLFWWNPAETASGFSASRDPGTALQKPLEWIRGNVPTDGVVLASPSYSAPIAALGGRRVLFPVFADGGAKGSFPEPARRARLLESALRGRPIERLAEVFSVTHLFLGPGEAATPDVDRGGEGDVPRLSLVLVYQDSEDFRIFRLAKK